MSWALFIDESGQDQHDSPYEVLAGIAVEDRAIWPLIQELSQAELACFGTRYTARGREAKASNLLTRKVFRHAAQLDPIDPAQRRHLAAEILADGSTASRASLTALAQAKLDYVGLALALAQKARATAFASIIPKSAPRPGPGVLRKDYAYLFERYFHFLNAKPGDPMGFLIFDELDKSASHVLLGQVGTYFAGTRNGKSRARLIVPEPLFVHSDLTTLVQLADLLAYIISWGLRIRGMTLPARPELAPFADLALRLRYTASGRDFPVYGYKVIADLRPSAK